MALLMATRQFANRIISASQLHQLLVIPNQKAYDLGFLLANSKSQRSTTHS